MTKRISRLEIIIDVLFQEKLMETLAADVDFLNKVRLTWTSKYTKNIQILFDKLQTKIK